MSDQINHKAKLSEADVRVIREWLPAGWKQKEVAAAFSVQPPAICKIINRKTWKWL